VAASERQQLADKIFRLANEQADAMLDLHSGGDHAVSAHYAIFTDDGSVAGKMSRAVAAELVLHLFGTPRPYPFPVLRDVP
jgi:predicted deacylase